MNCPICRTVLTNNLRSCPQCGIKLTGEIFQIALFRAEIVALHEDLEKKIDTLSEKLDEYERISVKSSFALPDENEDLDKAFAEQVKKSLERKQEMMGEMAKKDTISEEKNTQEKSANKDNSEEKTTQKNDENKSADKKNPNVNFAKQAEKKYEAPKPRQLSAFEIAVGLFFQSLFAPLTQFKDFFMGAYNSYKAQNKLPVFFLTIGGVFALLMGFGYLLSFVADETFEIVKICGTALSAVGFILLGIRLSPSEKMRDFGSAMIALGISINYLLIYFLNTSTVLTFFASEWLSMLLVLLNTGFAYYLALRYETRIVLVLSLFGGVFAPFYLNNAGITLFYFGFLWVLVVVTMFIAEKIAWKSVVYLAFVLVLSVFEGSIFSWYGINFDNNILAGVAALFAYTFYGYTFFNKTVLKPTLSAQDIVLISANSALYLLNLMQCLGNAFDNRILGFTLLANGLIFLAFFVLTRSQNIDKIHSLQILLAATFAAFAVPALLEMRINGVIWGVEALFLTILGFSFQYQNIRKEAYTLFGIAILSNLLNLQDIANFWEQNLFTEGYLNLMGLSINLFLLYFILKKNENEATDFEKNLQKISLTAAYWTLSASFWVAGHFYFRELYYNLAIIFLYAFLFLGAKHQNKWVESLGFAQLGFLLVGFFLSADQVNDFSFRFQTLYGKSALVEIYLSLWFIYFCYEKIIPEGGLKPLAFGLRVVFYLATSVLLLPTVFRFHTEYFSAAVWLSFGLSYLIYRITKNKLVIQQIFILAGFAEFFFFYQIEASENGLLVASATSAVILIGLWFAEKGFSTAEIKITQDENTAVKSEKWLFDWLLLGSVYHLSYILFLVYMQFVNNQIEDALFASILFFTLLTIYGQKLRPLQAQFILLWRSLQVFLAFSLIFYLFRGYNFDGIISTAPYKYLAITFLVAIMALKFSTIYRSKENHVLAGKLFVFDVWLTHLLAIGAYWGIIAHLGESWTGLLMTIVMVIHAILLIFNSTLERYSSLIRLSILIFIVALVKLFFKDLAAYSAMQRVIVMMVLGVLMLLGSFAYAKYKSKTKQN